ncbi:YraN family protein [Patescibacteria group bacterium]|nr:YraN family protein [Patescibacteria group bacterium]MBU4000175.1 YraN family protein [Patescibacteria group bacterium]MBU4056713.1 YraN family protein [Patescibacteria group bacterium]MBU4368661.1 YraN family protein [Patescibacteria group bacterium]
MITQKREFGDLGEKIAQEYLEKQGYKILDRNYSKRWGEIDLIAESPEKELVFVEIKTREFKNHPSVFLPEDSVNFSKQQKLIKTARTFLYENKYPEETGWRIDVIAVEINKISRNAEIRHIENAVEM